MRSVALAIACGVAAALSAAGAVGRQAERLPDAVFAHADGRTRSLAALAAETSAPRLLLRVQAEWCGTCQWHASWTGDLARETGADVRVVDVLVADRENNPPDAAALSRWQGRLPAGATTVLGSHGELRSLVDGFAPLPWLIVIDTRTAAIRAALTNPDPDAVMAALGGSADGDADRRARPASPRPRRADLQVRRHDGRFTPDQWALIQAMRLPASPPPDPTNRVADDPAAAAFGDTLFFDTRLSPRNRACASCHSPDLLFTNGKDVASEGAGPGTRNVPTILAAAHASSFLWDGRADTLWAQAVMPFEDPTEIGSSRLFVAHAIHAHHRAEYEALFGPMPPLEESGRFPAEGMPGTPAWAEMSAADQASVSQVLANIAKAISAFERQLALVPNALDRYAGGEANALTDEQKDGLQAFLQAGCAQCHYGPRLSDGAYHNLRFPTGRPDRAADAGRSGGTAFRRTHEFGSAGPFSDRPREPEAVGDHPSSHGAFLTPGLRGVPFTMPYGHGGGFGGLRSVIDAHRTGGLPEGSPFTIGAAEPWAQGFDPVLVPRIQAFLLTLRADLQEPRPPRTAADR